MGYYYCFLPEKVLCGETSKSVAELYLSIFSPQLQRSVFTIQRFEQLSPCCCIQGSCTRLAVTMVRPGSVWVQWRLTTLKATRGATSQRWVRGAAEQVCVISPSQHLLFCEIRSCCLFKMVRNDDQMFFFNLYVSAVFPICRCRCAKRFAVCCGRPWRSTGEEKLRSLWSEHQQLAAGGWHEHVST